MKGVNENNVPEQATESGDKLQQVKTKALREEVGAFLKPIVSHWAQDVNGIDIDFANGMPK